MSSTQVADARPRERVAMNGVDTPTLFATLNAVKAQPELGRFQFKATNRWIAGTHSRSRFQPFTGAGGEHRHTGTIEFEADHPAVLVGTDNAPTAVEFLLHAIAACITSGIGNIAAARGVPLAEVESTVEGDIDLRGILGLSDEVRNGYEAIRVSFRVKGDAPPEKLQAIVAQATARSAVFDVLTNGTKVNVTAECTQG